MRKTRAACISKRLTTRVGKKGRSQRQSSAQFELFSKRYVHCRIARRAQHTVPPGLPHLARLGQQHSLQHDHAGVTRVGSQQQPRQLPRLVQLAWQGGSRRCRGCRDTALECSRRWAPARGC